MDELPYPSLPGQPVPQLDLAQYAMNIPATELTLNSSSTPPQKTAWPPLSVADSAASIAQMGIDPAAPYFDLQLANKSDVMTPARLAAPTDAGKIHEPTSAAPVMDVPPLLMSDLSTPGLDHVPTLEPDPLLGDLLDFTRPGGLSVIAASHEPLTSDPAYPDRDDYDRSAALVLSAPLTPDPLLPVLQFPGVEQDVQMSGRPADLAAGALETLRADPGYQHLPTHAYSELYMEQYGDNQHRTRHLGMLELGLEREEHEQ